MGPHCGCWWSCLGGVVLEVGCGVEGEQKAQEGGCGAPAHLIHWDVGGWMVSAWGPTAATSLQLCWSVSGVRKEGEWWHRVSLKAGDRKALNITVWE